MLKLFALFIASIVSFNSLFATTISTAFKPQEHLNEIVDQQFFTTIGTATYSILFWDLYQSKLLTTSGSYPIALDKDKLIYEIQYLADISSNDLIKRTIEQWQHLGVAKAKYQGYLAELTRIWPNITKGDRLSLLLEQQHSLFYFNGNYIGAINSPEFGQLFLDIWLSKNTSEPSLRRDLLGKNNNE